MINYLSVCSGVEAASVAWKDLSWKAVGFSEIEPFPSAVLKIHYPEVVNYGDMTKYKEWNINESVNLIVGGTPCQSFSVSGLRAGLEDPRGNLALVFCGLLDKFRPKWFVWENVPGVLSSNRGRDFGSFLGAVAELGYGFSYRVLDAKNFGVPQRRRRVFVVGHRGDWQHTAKVLFEQDCLFRNFEKSRKTKQETYPNVGEGITTASGKTVFGTLMASAGKTQWSGNQETFKGDYHLVENKKIVTPITYNNEIVAKKVKQEPFIRRLMPIEAERLQGFPDNYTNIPWRNKLESPDGLRYKAMGNSMAVPVMKWIGERINNINKDLK
jgi:DNA (cytosine-5)-methyltransferase 1